MSFIRTMKGGNILSDFFHQNSERNKKDRQVYVHIDTTYKAHN